MVWIGKIEYAVALSGIGICGVKNYLKRYGGLMDKVMKVEIEKILEECFFVVYGGIRTEKGNAGGTTVLDYPKATSSLTSLIIKWLEEKRKTVWILQERQLIDKLITELIGEIK